MCGFHIFDPLVLHRDALAVNSHDITVIMSLCAVTSLPQTAGPEACAEPSSRRDNRDQDDFPIGLAVPT